MQYDPSKRLGSEFYQRSAKVVAPKLLGCKLVVRRGEQILSGWIVETEAYLDREDPACHGARGMTRSNATIFGPGGLLYVYTIHAKYCMNVVTGGKGVGQAVLIRALDPIDGLDLMAINRGSPVFRDLTRGPSRLCQALDIDRTWDGIDLTTSDDIWIEPPEEPHRPRLRITRSPRIGVTKAEELLLRYFVDGNMFVSGRVGTHKRLPVQRIVRPLPADPLLHPSPPLRARGAEGEGA